MADDKESESRTETERFVRDVAVQALGTIIGGLFLAAWAMAAGYLATPTGLRLLPHLLMFLWLALLTGVLLAGTYSSKIRPQGRQRLINIAGFGAMATTLLVLILSLF